VIEVDRTVNATGLVSLADQQVGVGLHLAGQRVTLRMEGPLMAVLGHDGTLLRTLACPIPADRRYRLRGAHRARSGLNVVRPRAGALRALHVDPRHGTGVDWHQSGNPGVKRLPRPARSWRRSSMTDVPPDAADRARALFGDFAEGRWEQTRGEFHENMRGPVDAGRIAHGWAHAASSVGGFERIGEPSARQFGDYTVVEVPLTFEAGKGLGRVALDHEGKVAGLSLQCPHRSRLDPRPVRVFVHGIPGVTDLITPRRPRHARQPPGPGSNP